jgi:hypothetical protein
MKNLKGLADFVDGTVGGLLSGWGCFTVLFFLALPLILVAAGIKWLFLNGFIG